METSTNDEDENVQVEQFLDGVGELSDPESNKSKTSIKNNKKVSRENTSQSSSSSINNFL